ncbi:MULTISPECIES: peptidoglycan D,D-transpeptidase FtsI family protein [Pseudomonas]|uniref:peptidoglycan D,D-transpeptidase FtsI family protein n=1 Tax=Pseudomonas TaxID=286 RepID=UPI0021F81B22|nr:penicillin-binding protein 2 [Pseudomonas putida]
MSSADAAPPGYPWRFRFVVCLVLILALVLCWRIIELQVVDKAFLRQQGDARSLRYWSEPAPRGVITDRAGQPLAVSTPMVSLWADMRELATEKPKWPVLAQALEMPPAELETRLSHNLRKAFFYLRRRLSPEQAGQVLQVVQQQHIKGIYSLEESRRFYPAGAIAAHVVGFTDIDNKGSEGLELAYDQSLRGVSGKQQVIKDRRGQVIQDLGVTSPVRPGQGLALSLDMRLQYFASHELEKAVVDNGADAGSVVILDVETGELLALANYPTYNPNNRAHASPAAMRNRALVDVFEPASTIKPFSVAAALQTGRWKASDTVLVKSGSLKVGKFTIRDASRTAGERLDMTGILVRSSNVAISQVAFDVGGETIHDLLQRVGLGEATGLGFPGERSGVLPSRRQWRPTETAALSYGYGVSVTAVQLAKAYATLVNSGRQVPVSLLRVLKPPVATQVMPAEVADALKHMLVQVVEAPRGIYRAKVQGYHVGGKSGTARKPSATSKGYQSNSYRAMFAGFAPADEPKFVVVVMIDNPTKHGFFGGLVSAPVFSKVMAHALRLYNIAPDNLR